MSPCRLTGRINVNYYRSLPPQPPDNVRVLYARARPNNIAASVGRGYRRWMNINMRRAVSARV